MDIAELLALAQEGDAAGAAAAAADAPPLRRRLTRGGRTLVQRLRGSQKKRKQKRSLAQLGEQVLHHNASGSARTRDHLMMPPGVSRPRIHGAGQWKRWTVPAVCKAAFVQPAMTLRGTRAVVGSGSHLHAAQCKAVISHVLVAAQVRGAKRLRQAGTYDAVIVNNMFDETKLFVDMGGTVGHRECSVLASHAQLTLLGPGGSITEDVIRPPKVLRRATAACTWQALTAADDPASINPATDSWPNVHRKGFITTTDAAAYNHLALKHLTATLPPGSYHLSCDCAQHRTAAVIESVTRQLGILSDCFCFAKAWKQGELFQDAQHALRERVQDSLRVVASAPLGNLGASGSPEGTLGAASPHAEVRRALLRVAYVQLRAADEDPTETGQRKRQAQADTLLAFFQGSSDSELLHVCGGAACGSTPCVSREDSVERATTLLLQVVFRELPIPALNKWTTLGPVIAQIGLMMCSWGLLQGIAWR
jgi:hypothetical protein